MLNLFEIHNEESHPDYEAPRFPYEPGASRYVDVYIGKVGYLWLQLIPPDIQEESFTLEELSSAEVGVGEFNWLGHEISNVGWDDFLEYCNGTDLITFALRAGVAPYQPFLARVREPRYYRCGEYDTEWDAEYYPVAVVWKAPLDPYQESIRWADALYWAFQYQEPVNE